MKAYSFRLFLICLLLWVSACSVLTSRPDPDKPILWPEPPAEPRYLYEGVLRSADALTVNSRLAEFQALVQMQQPEFSLFVKPYDIAARQGLLVVSDSKAAVVHVFDVVRKRVFSFGWRGQGRLSRPLGVAIDNQRNIYVADGDQNVIHVYSMLGHYKRRVGRPEDFTSVVDVAVSPNGDRIYALDRGSVDSNNHRLLVYSQDGEVLFRIGRRGSHEGEFNHPNQVAVGPDGDIYVLDAGNFRVQVFSRLGDYKTSWGKPGRFIGNLARPRGLAVDANGYVYVTDAAYQNFQVFDSSGQLLLPIGKQLGPDQPGRYLLPAGIAADETGRVYVVDQILRKVEILRLLNEEERPHFQALGQRE